jgi:hypothetical protein
MTINLWDMSVLKYHVLRAINRGRVLHVAQCFYRTVPSDAYEESNAAKVHLQYTVRQVRRIEPVETRQVNSCSEDI